ncbi:hypothetical protein AGMMS49944_21900 [Spirochaetia bacterium]|nr:hypothetical protein AGMMS49944_21900 [Spirochaetia bacterium]
MDTEKVLHANNETLRIAGMYSFLFYAVTCGVFVWAKDKIPDCIAVICGIAVCIFSVVFFVFAGIILFKANKKKHIEIETTEAAIIVVSHPRKIRRKEKIWITVQRM